MKRLISIIALVILTMSLAGCGFEYHRHHRHGPVVISRPVPRPIPPRHGPHGRPPRPEPRRGHPWR